MATQAPFRLGRKELHLPNFLVILKYSSWLPANYASFIVPIWFSKLDLRDYLYHAYNVRVGPSIRSYVKQSRIQQGKGTRIIRPQYKRWHRPRATKHMTVELERPFVWPAEPADYTDWNKEEVKMASEQQEEFNESQGRAKDALAVSNEHRSKMREQAKALLEGKVQWRPSASKGGMGLRMYER
ncbi:hypothetical protein BAUCODRAFT_152153 [Baudoinia panamericana UAMH 10762]|uniref:Large ribosomal subunit protein uL23m n=1 Tax=Baudoinia panamericana (strain UAMH 10762) TaxID=717646 RepID=M2MYM9_BAUPA|nr:uncharacterized protein BAUCODRAFT_152153 [Baudoinia panamericana UAMH 10762]EMC91774.1 hypothetical protein BAUCODRAFT_152153 [Baudoinia panamericana UAMH 10762]